MLNSAIGRRYNFINEEKRLMRTALCLLMLVAGLCFAAGGRAIHDTSLVQPTQVKPDQNTGAEPEKEAIRKVIQDYLAVTDRKDYEALKRSFHPSAKLMSVSNNGLKEMSQEEWWARVSRIPENFQRTSRISLIDFTGVAAVVRIDFDKSSDYISLLKLNGEWKIVNKTLSTMLKV